MKKERKIFIDLYICKEIYSITSPEFMFDAKYGHLIFKIISYIIFTYI